MSRRDGKYVPDRRYNRPGNGDFQETVTHAHTSDHPPAQAYWGQGLLRVYPSYILSRPLHSEALPGRLYKGLYPIFLVIPVEGIGKSGGGALRTPPRIRKNEFSTTLFTCTSRVLLLLSQPPHGSLKRLGREAHLFL